MFEWLASHVIEIGAYGSSISGVAALAVLTFSLADRREARRPRLAVSVASFQIGDDPLENPVEHRPMVLCVSQMAAINVSIDASLKLPDEDGELAWGIKRSAGTYHGGALAPGAAVSSYQVGACVSEAIASRKFRLEAPSQVVDEEVRALRYGVEARLRLTTRCTDFTGRVLVVEEHAISGSAAFLLSAHPISAPGDHLVILQALTFHGSHINSHHGP